MQFSVRDSLLKMAGKGSGGGKPPKTPQTLDEAVAAAKAKFEELQGAQQQGMGGVDAATFSKIRGIGAAEGEARARQAASAAEQKLTHGLGKRLFDSAIVGGGLGTAGYLGKKLLDRVTEPKPPSVLKSVFGRGGAFGKAVGFGLGGLTLGAGAYGASKLLSSATEPLEKKKAFGEMLSENPNLKQEDPKIVERSFRTLFTFNKDMAKDPTLAGSFVRKALMFKDEGIQPNDVKTMSEIRKNMSDAKKGQGGFLDLAKSMHAFKSDD